MNKRYVLLSVFILVAIVQLWVPVSMIFKSESILEEGKLFKFKTAPIDPVDPFRGKYITLSFEAADDLVSDDTTWLRNDVAFVVLETNAEGFAEVLSISREKPLPGHDYFQTSVQYAWQDSSVSRLDLRFPFDRYYMEESKAYDAEVGVREATRDASQVAYAIVAIKEGEARLKDVMVNEVPIKQWVEQLMEEK